MSLDDEVVIIDEKNRMQHPIDANGVNVIGCYDNCIYYVIGKSSHVLWIENYKCLPLYDCCGQIYMYKNIYISVCDGNIAIVDKRKIVIPFASGKIFKIVHKDGITCVMSDMVHVFHYQTEFMTFSSEQVFDVKIRKIGNRHAIQKIYHDDAAVYCETYYHNQKSEITKIADIVEVRKISGVTIYDCGNRHYVVWDGNILRCKEKFPDKFEIVDCSGFFIIPGFGMFYRNTKKVYTWAKRPKISDIGEFSLSGTISAGYLSNKFMIFLIHIADGMKVYTAIDPEFDPGTDMFCLRGNKIYYASDKLRCFNYLTGEISELFYQCDNVQRILSDGSHILIQHDGEIVVLSNEKVYKLTGIGELHVRVSFCFGEDNRYLINGDKLYLVDHKFNAKEINYQKLIKTTGRYLLLGVYDKISVLHEKPLVTTLPIDAYEKDNLDDFNEYGLLCDGECEYFNDYYIDKQGDSKWMLTYESGYCYKSPYLTIRQGIKNSNNIPY